MKDVSHKGLLNVPSGKAGVQKGMTYKRLREAFSNLSSSDFTTDVFLGKGITEENHHQRIN